MDMAKITAITTLLIALSIAAERLVEIIKGFTPALNQEHADPIREGRRRAMLQLLAVGAGIVTAWLAGGMIPTEVYNATTPLGILALGLLASGGSGFWNSILTSVTKVKDLKTYETSLKEVEVKGTTTKGLGAGRFPELWLGQEQVTSNECYDVEDV